MGQSSIVITLDTHLHLLPSMQQAATEKLENMLFASAGTLQTPKMKTGSHSAARKIIECVWLGGRDSNPDRRIQSPQSYR